jgi:CMP-N,N'-diacetyllegionaminic acid synthase
MEFSETLVIIPARGGSKDIPGKNIKLLANKHLIQYSVDVALEIFAKENICLSTDSPEIVLVAKNLGLDAPFLRPAHLATDESGTYEVLMHAIDFYKGTGRNFRNILLLQPTSPLRQNFHVLQALKLFSDDLDLIVSVNETKANPYYILYEENPMGFLVKSKQGRFANRQACPKVWQINGAVYVFNTKSLIKEAPGNFKRIKKYAMDPYYSIDIDTDLDWDFAEYLLRKYPDKYF